ncbi:MAG: thiamine pyrophosphate-binding protein [Chloroflexi bacterium]|nr:thiamine pyrophosphate-binding protein [Chloroflexota bacterium]MCL5075023.1 thiamine pyrophosphate-binding protein [Chloroflexota bacterium]
MSEMSGGQAVVQALKAEGVEVVFGIPGVHNLPIFDALLDCPEIRHIVTRHEQGAGFMADGYARATGKVGVAITITGPGATNALTALAQAYSDSSPVLLLTTVVDKNKPNWRQGTLHELKDQGELFQAVVDWNRCVTRPPDIPSAIHEAMERLQTGRRRAVQLEITTDALLTKDELDFPNVIIAAQRKTGNPQQVQAAADILAQAIHPLLYAGGGAISAGAGTELLTLAEFFQAPILTTCKGKGIVPEDHPLMLGNTWTREGPVAELLRQADVVLAVGTRFSEMSTANWTLPLPSRLMQVDIDEAEIGKNYPMQVGILGDAKEVLQQILHRLHGTGLTPRTPRQSEIAAIKKVAYETTRSKNPKEIGVLEQIRSALPRDAIVVNDPTVICYWAARYFTVYEPRTFLYPRAFGALGFSFPAALGAKVAFPKRQVIALCGDGGFLFTGQELATAVQYGLNVPVIVFNSSSYSAIEQIQRRRYGDNRIVDAQLHNPDFVKLAEAFGAYGVRVSDLTDLERTLRDVLQIESPVVVEVPADFSLPNA